MLAVLHRIGHAYHEHRRGLTIIRTGAHEKVLNGIKVQLGGGQRQQRQHDGCGVRLPLRCLHWFPILSTLLLSTYLCSSVSRL